MPGPMNISEARGKLPSLAKFLSRHPERVVVIEHRDLDDRLVLITERYLRYLETMVKKLKKHATGPFKLAGSIKSRLSDKEIEAALREIRESVAEQNERRILDLAP